MKLLPHISLPDKICIGLLLVITVVFFWRITLLGQILLPLDFLFTVEPWRSEAANIAPGSMWNTEGSDAVWAIYPMAVQAQRDSAASSLLWNPNVMAGSPTLAAGGMASYPINYILWLLMTPDRAIGWSMVLHVFLGSLFMYMLMRELGSQYFGAMVAALAFSFNTYLIGWIIVPYFITSIVWLPLVMWGAERALRKADWRWTLVGSGAFALQILGGSILWPFYGAITLGIVALYRGFVSWWQSKDFFQAIRPVFYTGLTLGVGSILIAWQLLLTIELFPLTLRDQASAGSSHLRLQQQLLRLLIPDFYGNSLYDTYYGPFNYVESGLYFGVLPLIFILAGLFVPKKRYLTWGFFGLGMITLLAVCGISPFRQIITFSYIIFLNTFPGRIFYITVFCWAIVAGFGADWIAQQFPKSFVHRLKLAVGILAVTVLIWGVVLASFNKNSPEQLVNIKSQLALSSLIISFTWIAMSALYLWSRSYLTEHTFASLGMAIIMTDLLLTGINLNSSFSPSLSFPKTPSIEFLENLADTEDQPYRILNVPSNDILPGLTGEVYDFPLVTGYISWVLERYSNYADLTGDRGLALENQVYYINCCQPLLNALNIKYVYTSANATLADLGEQYQFLTKLSEASIEAPEEYVYQTSFTLNGSTREVLFTHPPARVQFTGAIPAKAELVTAIGIDELAWGKANDGVLFEIYVTLNDKETRLFSQYLDPAHTPTDRRWVPVRVDLSAYENQTIALSFVTSPGDNGANDWAGWAEPRLILPSSLELIYDGPNKVYFNKAHLPRAWVVNNVIQVNNVEEVKQILSDSSFDPAHTAVIEGTLSEPLPPEQGESNVTILNYAAHQVEIQANLSQPGLLVLSDMFYPSWAVFVNGNERSIYATNLMMRGVYLEAGENTILFKYTPKSFVNGLYVTGGGIGLILLGFVYKWRSS